VGAAAIAVSRAGQQNRRRSSIEQNLDTAQLRGQASLAVQFGTRKIGDRRQPVECDVERIRSELCAGGHIQPARHYAAVYRAEGVGDPIPVAISKHFQIIFEINAAA